LALGLDEIEAPFNTRQTLVHAVEPRRQAGILVLKIAKPASDFTKLIGVLIKRRPDRTQQFENKVVGFHPETPSII